ncbi:MAG: phosphoribosyl-AMP cyclohydrolase [Pseudomonadota bacterium]
MSIEETDEFRPQFAANGLLPVVTIDETSRQILMLAYANQEAIDLTLATGDAHYWSRSRQELWRKGATSGHEQKVARVLTDCDQDTLIYEVTQKGAACHTGRDSCFYREVTTDGLSPVDA